MNAQDFQGHVRDTQTSLRVIAEETGGTAIVDQNDFDQGLRRIDAETSDYYLLGFVSNNRDPVRRTHKLEIRVPKGLEAVFLQEYSLPPLRRPKQVRPGRRAGARDREMETEHSPGDGLPLSPATGYTDAYAKHL